MPSTESPNGVNIQSSGVNALSLCLHRLHGKRVDAPPVRLLGSGLVLGADSDFLAAGASRYGLLHVAARHAVVTTVNGQWLIEPASRDMVLALNGVIIPWGEHRQLNLSDSIDMGFVSLRVELAAQGDALFSPVPKPSGTQQFSERVVIPAFPELLPPQATDDVADDTCSPAEELCALLALDAKTSAGSDSMHYAEPSVEAGSLESLLLGKAAAEVPAAVPSDPLLALAAESARVLSGKSPIATGHIPFVQATTPATIPVVMQEAPLPETDPFPTVSTATSLEAILEGPMTIDDVLDNLKRTGSRIDSMAGAVSDSFATLKNLSTEERAPDPLLLLAGLEAPPPREPELAPVLHREHRTTGMNTPYNLVTRSNHDEPNERDDRAEETPWPHPIR